MMTHPQQVEALLLMKAACAIIRNRRRMEGMCGYPPEYGGDRLLLKKLSEFLEYPDIQHEIKEALVFAKKFDKT
jgi:hypothetical protein